MKNTSILIAMIFVAGLFVACTNTSDTSNNTLESDSTTTSSEEEEIKIKAIPADPTDEWPPHTFGSSGLDFVKLGDTITFRNINTGAPSRDTVYVEQTLMPDGTTQETDWIVKIVEFEDGRVLLETDFESDSYLNRVQIETPSYKHVHTGLHVGSSVKDLEKVYGDMYVRPFPEYGVVELLPDNHNIFHVKDTGVITDDPDTWKFSNLPGDLKIVRIVVM